MKIRCLRTAMMSAMTMLAMAAFPACGTNTSTLQPDASGQPDARVQSDPFELQGDWLFLGPWSGEHTLKIGKDSMAYASVAGDGDWSSRWTIKQYDNALHHFQMTFESGTGTYYPTGQKISGTYLVENVILTLQLGDGLDSYPPLKSPGSCTDGAGAPIVDCRLYMKQN